MASYHPTRLKKYRIAVICVMSALLLACGDKDSAPTAVEGQTSSALPSEVQLAAGSELTPEKQAAAPTEAITQLPPYAPTQLEVRQAFRNSLLQQASQMPATPQRDEWIAQEVNRINAIQVGKCEPVPVGTPSDCYVLISGQSVRLKFLLTQSGWMIVG